MNHRPFTVIAHRGASGYLPEHTREAAILAHGMGADYIEMDVVLTRDDVPIVLHDPWLDAVTDVAERFPERRRPDGRHYAIDLDWPEIQTLRAHERVGADGAPAIPGRVWPNVDLFRVPSLDELIRLIRNLNHSSGREAGVYVEPKAPAWHAEAGRDVTAAVLEVLADHGYSRKEDRAYLQSFDLADLQRARTELGTHLELVQLIGENSWRESATDYDHLQTPAGLAEVAEFAQGIGPWLPQVIRLAGSVPEVSSPQPTGLVEAAHRQGLFVHAYTLRADQLPPGAPDFPDVVRLLAEEAKLDGVFTDHPDKVKAALKRPR